MSESFLVVAHDKAGADALRTEHREAHVAYLRKPHDKIRIEVGGPLMPGESQSAGTFLIVNAPDKAAVEAFVASDPFSAAGIFASVEIKPCKVTLRNN